MAHQNFVFGYGSLMCRHSRAATVGNGDVATTPVILEGWQVQWSTRTPYRMTALGIVPAKTTLSDDPIPSGVPDDFASQSAITSAIGVLVPVTPDELMQFDAREGEEYQRTRVALQHVHPVPFLEWDESYTSSPQYQAIFAAQQAETNDTDVATPSLSVWVYVQVIPEQPGPLYPISQSYLDVILRGCLDISPDFAVTFLQWVQGWQWDEPHTVTASSAVSSSRRQLYAYVNDRTTPIYIRGDIEWSRTHGEALDALIETHQPVAFRHRQIL